MIFSIDQNCHSLWDVCPKLHALVSHGRDPTHYVEDIDVAFTALGSEVGTDDLRLARERHHPSGGADWGAAMFYTEFLGRVPLELRDIEPYTGMKTKELAKKLGREIEDLYDAYSPSDNWQMIGSSFVGDKDHHRVIGDLSVAETADLLRELLARARANVLASFPAGESQQRTNEWFDIEQQRVEGLLNDCADASLAELYRRWTTVLLERPGAHAPGAVGFTSRLFACEGRSPAMSAVVDAFFRDYDRAAAAYNRAIAERDSPLRPLDVDAGELPLFATLEYREHLVRTGVWRRDGRVVVSDRDFAPNDDGGLPWQALAQAGVRCLAGKALLLVSQVRCEGPLAVPHRGSLYMPTAHAVARELREIGVLPDELHPVLRVRLRLLDRLTELDTPIRLPHHLAAAMGAEEVPARELGESWEDLASDAAERLERLKDEDTRTAWQREAFPTLFEEADTLDTRRREIARKNSKDPELREISKRVREIETELLDGLLRQIDRDVQVAELDYYDSRGAPLPWCVALGGEAFYDTVISRAEHYEEHTADDCR